VDIIDKHVKNGNGNHRALIFNDSISRKERIYTFSHIKEFSDRFSNALTHLSNIKKEDRCAILLPQVFFIFILK
jgi:acyl-coenzyme A synthetase/AMP-(fatty) acid ligase